MNIYISTACAFVAGWIVCVLARAWLVRRQFKAIPNLTPGFIPSTGGMGPPIARPPGIEFLCQRLVTWLNEEGISFGESLDISKECYLHVVRRMYEYRNPEREPESPPASEVSP